MLRTGFSVAIAVCGGFLIGSGVAQAQVHRAPIRHAGPAPVHREPVRIQPVHQPPSQIRHSGVAYHKEARHEEVHVQKMRRAVEVRKAVVVRETGENRPRMHAALAALQMAARRFQDSANGAGALGSLDTARQELEAAAAADVYHGHRYDAIECTKHAIRLLRESGDSVEAARLTLTAIGHVEFCIAAPRA